MASTHDGGPSGKVMRFQDLAAWRLGLKIAVEVYGITRAFPQDERYGLTSQLRRSANSITANIAEGFGRYALKEYMQFLYYARGSLAETESHAEIARAIGLLPDAAFRQVQQLCEQARRALHGLIRHVRAASRDAGLISEAEARYEVVPDELDF